MSYVMTARLPRSMKELLIGGIERGAALLCVLVWCVCAPTTAAQNTNNDSSCDIAVTPAATLLLPYFEVDFNAPPARARTTLFTVVNTSSLPQIARATIWTDWAYPVLTFDLFLTGYDVASINLYDILASGRLLAAGTSTAGRLSAHNNANPNHAPTAVYDCNDRPDRLSPELLSDVRSLLTTGRSKTGLGVSCQKPSGNERQVGSNHGPHAIGYMTIDVVATCSNNTPANGRHFTSELLFDNVLTGDWMSVSQAEIHNYATASPLVHIRAFPEGGPAGTMVPPQLPYTFYGRLLSDRVPSQRGFDRRQPLPSAFAARFIQGDYNNFQTDLVIWREAYTGAVAECTDYLRNDTLEIAEIVRFDEHENATAGESPIVVLPPPGKPGVAATSSLRSWSSTFPPLVSPHGDTAGWLYLNLLRANRNGEEAHGAGQHQAWVTVTMFSEERYAVTFDAAALQNGCTAPLLPGARIGGE